MASTDDKGSEVEKWLSGGIDRGRRAGDKTTALGITKREGGEEKIEIKINKPIYHRTQEGETGPMRWASLAPAQMLPGKYWDIGIWP